MRNRLAVGVAVVLASVAAWVHASSSAEQAEPPRVHVDGRSMATAVGDVSSALLRDDPEAANAALERLEASCRRLFPEDDEVFVKGFRTVDQAMHVVIGNTIRYVGSGELDRAFDEFVWVQRTCRQCHALARQGGLLPAKGPLWSESAAERVETTQSVGQSPKSAILDGLTAVPSTRPKRMPGGENPEEAQLL